MTETKQDNDYTDHIGLVYIETKMELSRPTNRVRFMMKTRQDNDVINRTNSIYAGNEIELRWPIRRGMICDETW